MAMPHASAPNVTSDAHPALRRALPLLLTVAALAAAGACDAGDASEPPYTLADLRARVAADSAAGDSAALATLPPALQRVLRLEPYLTDRYVASTEGADCLLLGDSVPDVVLAERRRVHLRLPDSSAVVVFVRADRDGATLRRVEVVRNPVAGEQVGFIWDGSDDTTLEVRWPNGVAGRPETARQPKGSPIPRALRALGRRALALTCPPDSLDAPFENVRRQRG
jgi:hypothetical protein